MHGRTDAGSLYSWSAVVLLGSDAPRGRGNGVAHRACACIARSARFEGVWQSGARGHTVRAVIKRVRRCMLISRPQAATNRVRRDGTATPNPTDLKHARLNYHRPSTLSHSALTRGGARASHRAAAVGPPRARASSARFRLGAFPPRRRPARRPDDATAPANA